MDAANPKMVCEIGGGSNPLLSLDEVGSRGLNYTVLDISQEELDKAPDGYDKLLLDITGDNPDAPGGFEFMFSHMLAEHVADPARFHSNVFSMLAPGGVAVHFMPTLYEPAFIINRLLPEETARRIVGRRQPWRKFHSTEGKFPAFYRWCRGPSRRHLDRFRAIGFHVQEATGYFGTGYLRNGVAGWAYDKVTRQLVRHPVPALCSYTFLVLQRPVEA